MKKWQSSGAWVVFVIDITNSIGINWGQLLIMLLQTYRVSNGKRS